MDHKEKLKVFRERLFTKATVQMLCPGEDGYEIERKLWNGAIKNQPSIVVLPKTAKDVSFIVETASKLDLPFSVKGGGHDWAGRALNHNGIVLSLKNLKNIRIDVRKKEAVVQGGVTAVELINAAERYGLVAVTGTVGVVGFAGLALGGGYGPLSPSYGLAADNLLSAEVILAGGEVIKASINENADLYWAIRGGGGNFGVITAMTIRLHDAKPLLSGMILFPWQEAEKVFTQYNDIMHVAPDELAMFAGVLPSANGSPVVFLLPAWNGDLAEGKEYIELIKSFGNPLAADVRAMKFSEFLAIFDPHIGNGLHYAIQTRWLPAFDAKPIAAVIDAVNNRTSPLSFINIHHFHGAAARIALTDTAFGIRKPHFMMEFIATWTPDDAIYSHEHQEWANNLSASVADGAYPGGYANLLGPGEHAQISDAFGTNLPRLLQVKHKYDEHNFFKGITIPF